MNCALFAGIKSIKPRQHKSILPASSHTTPLKLSEENADKTITLHFKETRK